MPCLIDLSLRNHLICSHPKTSEVVADAVLASNWDKEAFSYQAGAVTAKRVAEGVFLCSILWCGVH